MISNYDFKRMGYCCAECGDNCIIYQATVENNLEVKKQIAEMWTYEKGEEFAIDDVFCYGCKKEGMPQNKALFKCAVRICAKEKHFESCAQCNYIEKCDKTYWNDWPNVRTKVIEIQKTIK